MQEQIEPDRSGPNIVNAILGHRKPKGQIRRIGDVKFHLMDAILHPQWE